MLKRAGKRNLHPLLQFLVPSHGSRRIILKLSNAHKIDLHSKDCTYLGPHQWNVNIRIVSVTTSSGKVIIWLDHSQYNVLPPMTVSARRFETIAGPHKTSWTGQQNPVYWSSVHIPFDLFKHDVNLKRYWDDIVPITAYLLRSNITPKYDRNFSLFEKTGKLIQLDPMPEL